MSNMHKASRQWASRPADERFWTLKDVLIATQNIRRNSKVGHVNINDLKMMPTDNDDLELISTSGNKATMGHFAMTQLCRLSKIPAEYIRTLPSEIAAVNMNWGLSNIESKDMQLLLNANGHLHCRAITTEVYKRLWNCEIVERMMPLESMGWKNPPARAETWETKIPESMIRVATTADEMPCSLVKAGERIAPSGLYASDKDMFLFMVNANHAVEVPGSNGNDGALYRGFILENSEVGDRAFKLTTFLFNCVCGNHIIWGARNVEFTRIVHKGDDMTGRAWRGIELELVKYAESSSGEDQQIVKRAMTTILGKTKLDVVDALFKARLGLSQTEIEVAYDTAEEHPEDRGNCLPTSVWGMAQGFTRMSQESQYADQRTRIDRLAGKVVQMAF